MERRTSISDGVDDAGVDAAEPSAGSGESGSTVDSLLRKVAHISHLSAGPPLPRLGQVIGEKYRIEARLGRGGMGVVFRATHLVSRKAVALKWMLRSTTDEVAHRRLLREALAAGRIDHPNVVDVYDVGEEGACAYLVMELLHGEALRARLERGRLDSGEAIDLLLPALRGVSAAHRAGVIHRDLKPDNIFLCTDPDGSGREAKVLDFGVSAIIARSTIDSALTTDGAMTLGTPAYMSPEQLAAARDLDVRADVYAFGVILYEALTGQLPFVADSYSGLVLAVAQEPPKPPCEIRPDIPHGLQRVILQALSKRREDRPESVDALHDLLAPFGSAQHRAVAVPRKRYHAAAGHSGPLVPLALEQIFARRYRVRRRIAEGRAGEIFEAEHINTERRVALKVLHPHLMSVGKALEMFELEAKISARVNSPYIVEVLDAGYDEKRRSPFLVMELLEGQTLEETVRQEGPLEARAALRLLAQVASGLDAAHAYRKPGGTAQPIVHCHLKPKNLFLARQHDGSSSAKILGYGIAKVLDETGVLSQVARGTPLFMSFEQITGGTLSPQTDVWALGLVAFHMLTGGRYWRSSERTGASVQALFAEILTLPLEAPSVRLREQGSRIELPAAFDAWLLRCLDREPQRRFASAGVAVEALAQVFEAAARKEFEPPPAALGRSRPGISGSGAPLQGSAPGAVSALATTERHPASPRRAQLAVWLGWAVAGALVLGAIMGLMSAYGGAPTATSPSTAASTPVQAPPAAVTPAHPAPPPASSAAPAPNSAPEVHPALRAPASASSRIASEPKVPPAE
jgi:eukaryotic-like serine/threonine-protein kinase